jgi:hypothetical protein
VVHGESLRAGEHLCDAHRAVGVRAVDREQWIERTAQCGPRRLNLGRFSSASRISSPKPITRLSSACSFVGK